MLYQIHTRDWLLRCSPDKAHPIFLDQLPDTELDRLAQHGFDWLWLLGVWQTGPAGANVSRTQAAWRPSFEEALPDLTEHDIVGSPFAISAYVVHRDFGGDEALADLRTRLAQRGIKLLLDFVANHTALDHPWATEHPDYYVAGTQSDLAHNPANYATENSAGHAQILAHGRDPYFPGWPDTLQLNYGNPTVQIAMLKELEAIAARCDAVRCDMAMLLLPDVFSRTWGIRTEPFWPKAMAAARAVKPDFLFVAEVYWGLDWELQQQRFDYTYDKTLYDRLLSRNGPSVRAHLTADIAFQQKSVRFLENHDEPRAAAAFPVPVHQSAAIVAFLVPGMRFLHDGQLEGYVRKPSIHLARRGPEPGIPEIEDFYRRLLPLLGRVTQGNWLLLDAAPAWQSNGSNSDFLTFGWFEHDQISYLVAVNYADHDSQCYVPFPAASLAEGPVVFRDTMSPAVYTRNSGDLSTKGLYLALPAWGYHVFQVSADAG